MKSYLRFTGDETITVKEAVAVLNDMLKMDPIATKALMTNRVTCNDELANHPTIQVLWTKEMERPEVGALGIINGLFGVDKGDSGPIQVITEGDKAIEFKVVTYDDDENA